MGQYDAAIAARLTTAGNLEVSIGGQSANERRETTYWENVGAFYASGNFSYNPTFYLLNNTSGTSNNGIYFKSVINAITFNHQIESATPSVYEKVMDARSKDFGGAGFYGETVFYFNNAFYIGAYSKNEKQFAIYRYAD